MKVSGDLGSGLRYGMANHPPTAVQWLTCFFNLFGFLNSHDFTILPNKYVGCSVACLLHLCIYYMYMLLLPGSYHAAFFVDVTFILGPRLS